MSRRITQIRKRDGRVMPFDETKISDAIFKAARAVGGEDRYLAEELAGAVADFLERHHDGAIPGIEDIQDMVEKVLIETGHARTGKAYILYRQNRTEARRKLQVRKMKSNRNSSSTDLALMVDVGAGEAVLPWDKSKIVDALEKEAGLEVGAARKIAGAVEEKIFAGGISRISTSLIRELVDNELFERGLTARLERQTVIGMPKYDIDQLVFSKSRENSNITANNPEAINLAIAENTLKQYALQEIFPRDVSDAHLEGRIHLHDLGYPTRVYCSSHSLEYLKKYGLELQNLDTSSAPAKYARTLTGHLNTFLASMQAYYAGALGVGYINIFYAPYVEEMGEKEMRQEAQHLIFSCSQSAFSRGGQTLFLDFNIHTGVPRYLRDVSAIGPGGRYTGRTYGEYEETAQKFARAMMDVWRAGDQNGHLFAFPKCDLHINNETFSEPAQLALLQYACEIASENGVPYFVFDRDEVTLSACCRLRTTIEDDYMIKHPESMRFCGFQNVTINLPQASYRAGPGNWDQLWQEIDVAMELAMKAHLRKKAFIKDLMSEPHMPLYQIGRIARDGRPYVDLEKATYIIGIIGLNECIEWMIGKQLHEDDEALKAGLRVISHMHDRTKTFSKKHGLKVALEESPAESAARRLAKIDLRNWPQTAQLLKGDIARDEAYYTNSIHLAANAPVDMLTRIIKQSKFHTMIESGAIIHAFVGEECPSASSIFNLVEKTFRRTAAAQLTISPEFTVCNDCGKTTRGIKELCSFCTGRNVYSLTRIVGYFSRITNWNKSKLGELRDRHRGDYSVSKIGQLLGVEARRDVGEEVGAAGAVNVD
ncbi:MAG: anaerobic ribonucleoside-triphosphate reductase [Planctomycetia bacterium]|nr:anaerobic ribonucleoside-triphosphate reductase [Planctomycetia bacterium]